MFDNITGDDFVSGLIWAGVLFLLFGRKAVWILIIGGAGVAVLLWGTDTMLIGAGFAVVGVVGAATSRAMLTANSRVLGRTQTAKRERTKVVRAYNIRRKSDGYPMTVPYEVADRAALTGGYIFEGAATDEGGHYTTDDTYVPWGYIVDNGAKYQDERLNF